MIILLSPSKSMAPKTTNDVSATLPDFLDKSRILVDVARAYTIEELQAFMGISSKLAALNHQRFSEWSIPFTPDNATPAALTFTGDVYDGLEAHTLDKKALAFAQEHIRILSGLYGLLRPLDLIQPYRLEMGRPLKTDETPNLYAFWKNTLTEVINALPGEYLINLASQEYFKVLDKKKIKKQIISPIFKDEKNGTFKIISFYAKKARGLMARYCIENQVKHATDLHTFNTNGYRYNPDLSVPEAPVFTRTETRFEQTT